MNTEFDPWTATEAEAIQASRLADTWRDGEMPTSVLRHFVDDDDPLQQWCRAQHLLEQRSFVDRPGARGLDILAAVAICARHRLKMPDWVADAFVARFDRVWTMQRGSWSDPEVFGNPFPPDFRVDQQRLRRADLVVLHKIVERFKQVCPGAPMRALWDLFRPGRAMETYHGSADPELLRMIRDCGFARTRAMSIWSELKAPSTATRIGSKHSE